MATIDEDLETLGEREFYHKHKISKSEHRKSSGMHHPQTEQAVANATDASPTRSNANEVADGSPSNQAPNNAGSNTDPDKGKPDGKPKQGTAKPKKAVLNRKGSVGKKKMIMPKQKTDQTAKMQQGLKEQQRVKEMNAAFERRKASRDAKVRNMGRRGSIGAMGLFGAVIDGAMTYSAEREEDPNGSKIMDMAKAGTVAAGWMFASGLMWSIAGANMAVAGGKMLYEDANENYQKHKKQALHITQDESGNSKGTLGGQMIDSDVAYTMRQRSEQVLRQHKIATETILGSEARQLHR